MTGMPPGTGTIAFGPRIRKSPFFDATREAGFFAFTVYNHMYMPLFFESPVADYEHLTTAATLWDVACERQVEVSGPDAAAFMQYLSPRDISRMKPGHCVYTLLLTDEGGVLNDPLILRLDEDRFWLSVSDSDVLLWAKGLAHGRGYDVAIDEPDVSPLQIQGPRSRDVVAALFGDWVDDLNYFRFRETALDGIPVVLSRTGWSGELGYEVFLRDGARGTALWDRIMAAGAPFGLVPAAPNLISRIEAGLISYGADATITDNPYQLDMAIFVDPDQPADFVGKGALHRLRAAGVDRKLVGVVVDGPPLPANEHPWPVFTDAGTVGRVTSLTYAPRFDENLGLAMVDIGCAAPDSRFHVATPAGERAAVVRALPFRRAPDQRVRF